MELQIEPTVARALADGQAVVAMESTIFSELGLPAPANEEALQRCRAAITAEAATPALTAVLDGKPSIGFDDPAVICGPAKKAASRDLGVAIGQRWAYGATTVSASVTLAAAAGIEVFATGGIGGVHRGWADDGVPGAGDISADLGAMASQPVITVSAGAKVFLDLPATLERLESDQVPVLGWQCDEFPAFHARSSGLAVPQRVETAREVAEIARAHWDLGGGGLLVVAPVPEANAIDRARIETAVDAALDEAARQGVRGAGVTPVVLAGLAEATDGDSIATNLALAENNASVAAQIAAALSARRVQGPGDRAPGARNRA